jgi:hypothetical protein
LLSHVPGGLEVAEEVVSEGKWGDIDCLAVEGVD